MVIEPVPLSSWVVGVVYVLGVWDETLMEWPPQHDDTVKIYKLFI